MLQRRGSGFEIRLGKDGSLPRILRLTSDPNRPLALRRREGFLFRDGAAPDGFAWTIFVGTEPQQTSKSIDAPTLILPESFAYLGDGDVVRIDADRGGLSVLYQKAARHNSFLLTERCNHYCLMCSQPPRDVDDGWIFDDLMAAIPLVDVDAPEISFTGGEPTLLGQRLVELVRQCKSYLPHTGLHVLTNGRKFVDQGLVDALANVGHHDLMFGIPIYSDASELHDYVVQSDGAFDETIRGILNLKRRRLAVEIRVVIHNQTYSRLPDLARLSPEI